MKHIKKHPILSSFLLSAGLCLILAGIPGRSALLYLPFSVLAVSLFLLYPFVLTAMNLFFCVRKPRDEEARRTAVKTEAVTMVLGVLFSLVLSAFSDINFRAHWSDVLTGFQIHSPVLPEAWPTVIVFLLTGFSGYGLLRWRDFKQMPPLWIVLGISAMYMGMAVCAVWIIQLTDLDSINLYLCLFPLNWIFICIRVIREKALDWKAMEESEKRTFSSPLFERLNQKVMDSGRWPLWAFLLVWPLVGVLLMILALFGQRPDNLIRAWTETSQWNLSSRISPPNEAIPGHYLCTVAACGHRTLVKPLRTGCRRGNPIVVNRQLCIANAFEQVLEERVPKLHRKVRNFYDSYGLPISRLIRSPYASDLVYLLMKPLEWVFLGVLYLSDARPEDRIWRQYVDEDMRKIQES